MSQPTGEARHTWPDYVALRRWHFYAGIFCLPFFLWLAITGAIYVFKPQIETWLDRPYENLPLNGARPAPSAEVQAALAAVPGSAFSHYEPPATSHGAAQVLVQHDGALLRVHVDPRDLHAMSIIDDDMRPMNVVSRLHGELLLGDQGSTIIEVAGSWGIVMVVTGMCLWWPRGRWQAAGLFYPRLGQRGRSLWRELHSVAGAWISLVTLSLLLSGLPWTANWGRYLNWIRNHWQATQGVPDWPIGGSQPGAQNRDAGEESLATDLQPLDRLVPLAQSLNPARPVWIAPPASGTAEWSISSHAQNRPQRVTHLVDAERAVVTRTQTFKDLNVVDRIVNIGVAAHEGQLFGWVNQALLLINATGIVLIAVTASLMWWRRRPPGHLGAPASSTMPAKTRPFVALVVSLAILLPLFGLTLLSALAIEFMLLRRLPKVARWLGIAR